MLMDWVWTTLYWYFILFVLGLLFFPITKKLFSSFFDQGYAFSKTIAILVLSYAAFVLGTLKLLPFSRTSLIVLIILFALPIFLRLRASREGSSDRTRQIILLEEILFLASLFFLAFIRGQEPSIRGLEKFMDFGFMNSILRSKYFPPLDMWLSADPSHPQGYPINYYYFGHLTGAFLMKLSAIKPTIGYNLILATIFAQGVTLAFSLSLNLVHLFKKIALKIKAISLKSLIFFGLLGSFIVNLGGNLHTIYLFTTGYPNESPIPFWKILSTFNPAKYWYPNATRFIPFTIHEFPSYSYVVADLHGHVFDIPFVLLTLAILLVVIIKAPRVKKRENINFLRFGIPKDLSWIRVPIETKNFILSALFLGFMIAVHYMTNAFDGPIYLLLTAAVFFYMLGPTLNFLITIFSTIIFFIVFSLPFTLNFKTFVSGIGINCSPDFLVRLQKLGPFIFEQGNCQVSPLWMLFVLWGFFFVNFILFVMVKRRNPNPIDNFILIIFWIGTLLLVIPEFFYVKDIYPAHFRANTMFKLGYQAFIMMGIASAFTFYRISLIKIKLKYPLKFIFLALFFLIFLYPFFAFPSYYGNLKKPVQLDGSLWMQDGFSQDKEIIEYINSNIESQPVILEAQGDSYTDYDRISAYTGIPTVAGWWVHEWLWRGSPDVVGGRISDIETIYQSADLARTYALLKKYNVKYVIVSLLEREKYKNLSEDKFEVIGNKIFESNNKFGALYQLKLE